MEIPSQPAATLICEKLHGLLPQELLCSDARMKKPGTLRVRASSQLWTMAFLIQEMFRKVKENLPKIYRQENLGQENVR